jgi:hypothetical protein
VENLQKQGFAFLLGAIFVMLTASLLFSGGFYAGSHLIANYRTSRLQMDCAAIDQALEMYAKAHQNVLLDSVKENSKGTLSYARGRAYPNDLQELGIVQTEDGYFTEKIDLSQFTYTANTDATGAMTYELGVTLPNGSYYKSPRSNH